MDYQYDKTTLIAVAKLVATVDVDNDQPECEDAEQRSGWIRNRAAYYLREAALRIDNEGKTDPAVMAEVLRG